MVSTKLLHDHELILNHLSILLTTNNKEIYSINKSNPNIITHILKL